MAFVCSSVLALGVTQSHQPAANGRAAVPSSARAAFVRPGTLRGAQKSRNVVVCATPSSKGPENLSKAMVGSWLDLASLVSGGGKDVGTSEFATSIGADIYVDVNGWHLFLRDMKINVGLANALSAKMAGGTIDERDVVEVLKKVPVKLGAGRTTVSLFDVMPARCVEDLTKLAQKSADDW